VKIVQVALHVDDADRAVEFWTRLLGAGPAARYDPPGLVFFDLDGTRLMLDREAPASMLYLHVPGVRERLEELRAAGVVVESEPNVIFHHDDDTLGPVGADEWQAFVRDSEGNLVGLVDFA
jgi:methylmalonyl-CoA/ethylmalonyl-CoA epimerase